MLTLPVVLALGLITAPAHAKGKRKGKKKDDGIGLRLKVGTDLASVDRYQTEYDGKEVDGADKRITGLSLFESGSRLEATYSFMKNAEAGLILGYSQARGTQGDAEIPVGRHTALGLTGAYNVGLGNGFQAFAQPILMLDSTITDASEETELKVRYTMVGADVGVRWKAAKRITLDLSVEGLVGRGKATQNGESDAKLKLKYRTAGLRTGLTIKL